LAQATWATLQLGLGGAALTMLLAFPLGFLAVCYDGRLIAGLERTTYLYHTDRDVSFLLHEFFVFFVPSWLIS
jgi:ABC-type dipeptide/oligopeptide/nickel transport system permease component